MADSYSVRTFEDYTAMGVIAVAVYREKGRPKPLYQGRRLQPSAAAPSADSSVGGKSAMEKSAGTGFGDEQYSPVVKVAFEPAGVPLQKTLVKYEWREVLCEKGILNCRHETRNRLWDRDGYAPYPPGYPER